jgi:hypothetical protein
VGDDAETATQQLVQACAGDLVVREERECC